MRQYNLYEAKTQLSQLVQAALDGEEVLIARAAGKVAVRLVPVASAQPATGGWGALNIDALQLDAAFAPAVESEVARLFGEGSS